MRVGSDGPGTTAAPGYRQVDRPTRRLSLGCHDVSARPRGRAIDRAMDRHERHERHVDGRRPSPFDSTRRARRAAEGRGGETGIRLRGSANSTQDCCVGAPSNKKLRSDLRASPRPSALNVTRTRRGGIPVLVYAGERARDIARAIQRKLALESDPESHIYKESDSGEEDQ